ncbi:MAG TPA: head GIN domain-containing protein, partial [Spirochaetales bacterium]|nr:head GIN domain-containing protein [Spirochaetales bacterium]
VDSERSVSNFKGISFSAGGEIRITKGPSWKVTVRLDSNLQDAFEAKLSGGILMLGFKSGTSVSDLTELIVTISMPELVSLSVSGAADITVGKGFSGPSLNMDISGGCGFSGSLTYTEIKIDVSGTASFTVEGSADKLSINSSGSTDFDGRQLLSKTANVSLSGLGDITLAVSKELTASISGMGTISYYGSPTVKQSVSGLGQIQKINQ